MQNHPRPLARSTWRARLREPRVATSILAGVIVVAVTAAVALSGRAPDVRGVVDISPDATETPAVGVLPATFSPIPELTPVPPDATPEGVTRIARSSATIPSTPLPSPTPTPDPKIWRFEGTVIDDDGKPLKNACVIIGPKGCRPGSIRTDDHGRYYVDLPQNANVTYDFFFSADGREVVWYRFQPKGPTVFNVILRRV